MRAIPRRLRRGDYKQGAHVETLSAWRQIQAEFRTMLEMVAIMRENRQLRMRDWGTEPPRGAWAEWSQRQKTIWAPILFRL